MANVISERTLLRIHLTTGEISALLRLGIPVVHKRYTTMSFSRRSFLCASTLLLGRTTATAYQAISESGFRFIVWTFRPVVKHTPTPDELEKNSIRWMKVLGFDKPYLRKTSDQKILHFLRSSNPLLTVPRIEQRLSVTCPPDTMISAPLTGGISFKMEVKVTGRETAISEIAKTNGAAIAEEFRGMAAQSAVIRIDTHIPNLDDPVPSVAHATVIKGYRGVKLGFIYAVNPDLSYETKLTRAGHAGMAAEYVVRQVPNDVVLFCLDPIAIGKAYSK